MAHLRFAPILIALAALAGCKVSKEEWTQKFVPATAKLFCAPAAYFRHCFQVDEAGCLALATAKLDSCVEQHRSEIPASLDAASGEAMGRKIGSCAGRAYEVELAVAGKRLDAPRCNDPAAWQ